MVSDAAQPQKRPTLDSRRSHSSSKTPQVRNVNETSSDSQSNTPPTTHRSKTAKGHHHHHLVASRTGLHTRVPSSKGLHKLTKAHAPEGHGAKAHRRVQSPAASPPPVSPMKAVASEEKLSRNGSAASLKKNSSQVQLKRNRSSAEVKRPRSAGTLKRSASQPRVNHSKSLTKGSVHFDLGTDGDDGWTEASGSGSPSMSRSGSIGAASSGRNSAKPPASTSNSEAQSLSSSPTKGYGNKLERNVAPDARQITSRLLQRNPSHNAPPQMSSISATATPTTPAITSPNSDPFLRGTSTVVGSRSTQDVAASRFLGSTAGTPQDNSPFLQNTTSDPKPDRDLDAARRVKSMGNMAAKDSATEADSDDERILAPRSRKSSTHAYNPPQQSRTQQKLWLQRASSNIEPQQLAPSAAMGINGFTGLMAGINSGPLVGAGYDGKDPRVRLQLEKTGAEYLVVRRYQDPVGRALRRLEKLPGNEKMRRIPGKAKVAPAEGGGRRYGLSQSLKEGKDSHGSRPGDKNGTINGSGARSSYEGNTSAEGSAGSIRSGTAVDDGADGDGVDVILRSLWEKSFEMSPSAE